MAKKVCIAICTRERPKMLQAAARSVLDLAAPEGSELCLLIVENERVPQFDEQKLKAFLQREPGRASSIAIRHLHNATIGIASTRNTALDFARREGFDYLAFIDDDEVVDREWLDQLTAAAHANGFALTGGPVTPVLAADPTTPLQRAIWAGYQRQRKRRRERAEKLTHAGKAGRVVAITSNWLLDLRDKFASDLRFNERFDLTGGEDTDFYRRLRERNATTGWAPKAHVFETIPLARLSMRYQLQRNYWQSCNKMREKTVGLALSLRLLTITPPAVFHLTLGSALLFAALPSFGWTLFDGVRHLGSGVGTMAAIGRGNLSGYQNVTGS